MTDNTFFDELKEQSEIKATIVEKYFWAWAKVILSTERGKRIGKIAYFDLFAGPGRYRDGSASTPLRVLNKAIADDAMAKALVAVFNDKDEDNSQTLEKEIRSLENVDRLRFRPEVWSKEVGTEIVKQFESGNLVPTLMFVDPWGYKGLSLRLVNSVLKDWACECIFFFNYNRINPGLGNQYVQAHIDQLFGDERAAKLRHKLQGLGPRERELEIIEQLCLALKEMGGKFVLPFRFKNQLGTRTSHHLIFVSKNHLGYEIMKGVMAGASSSSPEGVASFEYNPADKGRPFLFGLVRPLDDLAGDLLKKFSGRTLTVRQIFEAHNVDTSYILKNYQDVLRSMEANQKVQCNPPASERPKRRGVVTLAEKTKVYFPVVEGA